MKKKIYLIQPTYRDQNGDLLKGKRLYIVSLALPALSALVPGDWEKQFCSEYFENVDFDTDASVIGISSMGYELFRGVEIAQEFRRRGKLVLFGGFQPHISSAYLREHCDAIIHGNPGRADLAAILDDALAGTLREDYYCATDLNYSFDYSVLDTSRLLFAPVLLGVGCRNRCDYCCVASIYQGRYHLRRLSDVMSEFEYLHRRTRRIAFVDTNAYNDREYLKTVCREMIHRKFRFIWGAQATVDIGDDPDTLALMRRAGCRLLYIGLETVDQANLDAMHKRHTTDSYRRKIRTIHGARLRVAAFFMYGLDSDTRETAARMSRFIIDTRIALPMLNVLVPTPGTPVYDMLRREGRIRMAAETDFLQNNPAYNSSFNLCFYQPKHLSPEEVEDGFIDLLRRLSGIPQLVRRSLSWDLPLSFFLLAMNLEFRKEYLLLQRNRAARPAGSAAVSTEADHG
jgi:radical SAM superfamily enzyme YgiQ (UPF0313 family)